jgi:hypothetical protein
MKETHCSDEKRVNELSFVPGGYTVTVQYKNGGIIHYDKIKHIEKYVRAINKADVVKITCENKIYYQNV